MKRYSFTILCVRYLTASATLREQVRLEKWIEREEKRKMRFANWVQIVKWESLMWSGAKKHLDKVNALRVSRGLPPL